MKYTVYVLRTNKDTLYIGQTQDLATRLEQHRSHIKGAKYLTYFDSFKLVYSEEFATRSEAMHREAELKKLSKKQKEALVSLKGYT